MTLPFLIEKEFKQIFRNPVIIGVMIFFTALVLLVFPWAINFELEDAAVAVVNHDRGTYAIRLAEKIDSSPTFRITGYYHSYDEANRDVSRNRATVIVVIPEDFSRSIEEEKQGKVMALFNAVDGSQASVAQGYLTGLISSFSSEILKERTGLTQEDVAPVEIIPEYRYNDALDSKTTMLPAFLAMLLTMFCGIFSAMSIVLERENGSLQQINVTPIHPSVYITAKVLPFWLLGVIVVGLGIVVIRLIYGIAVMGSIPLLFLVSLSFIIAISLFGVIISNLAESLQQAMFLVLFFILILFLVSGLFTPINAMPIWAQGIAYANPLTYYIHATRLIYLRGATFGDVRNDFLFLLGFCLVLGTLATLTYHKRQ